MAQRTKTAKERTVTVDGFAIVGRLPRGRNWITIDQLLWTSIEYAESKAIEHRAMFDHLEIIVVPATLIATLPARPAKKGRQK